MSNPISSPYADFIQEQKKQKYLKKIDVFMISSYKIEYYSRIIRLQNCVLRTLCKNDGKILNKNILEKINNEVGINSSSFVLNDTVILWLSLNLLRILAIFGKKLKIIST